MGQAAGQGQSNDDGTAPLWIAVFLVIVSMLIWYYNHGWIVIVLFKLNIWQAKLVDLLWPGQPLVSLIQYMETINVDLVDWPALYQVTTEVGKYTRYIYGSIIMLLAFFLYQKDISNKFCKVYSMKTLRMQEQENWPSIAPVIKEDLTNTDIDSGPWAMALSPMQFCRKYHLLKKNDLLLDSNTPGQEMTASIKKADAKRLFTMQLGSIWEDFDKCQPHVIALAAIFIARINQDRDSANHISSELSKSFALGKINYSSAFPILAKYRNQLDVLKISQSHAYIYTFMASLLEKARDDGVVPSSEFLWLKPIDRRLWYTLNCVGRQTPFSEVGGVFAHWKAEKCMQRPCLTPMIDDAVKALELAIKDVKLTPEELKELPL